MVTGRCECAAVSFEIADARNTITFCHCSQCRRISGHYWASTRVAMADITFTKKDGLAWFASSEHARRGFCKLCGSPLFYQPNGADHLGVSAGCLDLPTNMTPGKHIFTANAGDY
ncbi:MAG: GFA family protein, partial [Pseudomonadota bacterium]